jgi:hypothetical protein
MDNFNTEYTERLHIEFAKDAYAATNHKDEFVQMATWQERKEKVHQHTYLVHQQLEGSPLIVVAPHKWVPPGLELDCKLHTSRSPSVRKVALEVLETEYGALHFRAALRHFVLLTNSPHLTSAQVERGLWDIHFHFQHLPVWHKIKFLQTEVYTGRTWTVDSIHAYPQRFDVHSRPVPCRFDTALINDGTGGETGVTGKSNRDPKYPVITKFLLLSRQAIVSAMFASYLAFLSTHSRIFSQPDIKFRNTWCMLNGTQHLLKTRSPTAVYSRYHL